MSDRKKKTLGREIIEGLTELCRAVKAREPLRRRFTVRTARKPRISSGKGPP